VQTGNGGRARLGALVPVVAGVLVAAAVVIGFLYVHAPRATRVRVGDLAPDFILPSVVAGDPPVRLSQRRGGPTLLLFFDSRKEGGDAYFVSLQRLHAKYFPYGLTVLAVAIDPTPAALAKFADRNGVTFPVLADPFAAVVHPSYGTPRDPEAYLLDAQGRVLAVYTERVDVNTTSFHKQVEQNLRLPGR
jgi:peroxiredoxin Q/BCP